ncbi:MAG: 4-alpha-glucanotransferase [Bacilli bacterium]|nr:4-alpha-glucanotransferase [Bacilli bacterium]
MIKIIFVDIDCTILDHSYRPPRFDMDSINALKAAQKKGVKVFLATARAFHSVEQIKLLDLIKPDGMVLANGGIVIYEDKIIYENVFENEFFYPLCEAVLSLGLTLEASEPYSRFLISEPTPLVDELFASFHEETPPVMDYHNHKIITAMLFAHPEDDEKIKAIIPKELSYYRFHNAGVDIVQKPNHKGIGVKFVLDYLNISKDEAMCFGDDYGDISMFNEVKYAIAMGNARDEVKGQAYHVTNHVSKCGVKAALIKYNIITKEDVIMKENLGVLMPVASLPGRHGIGDFSKSSRKFIDWLKKEHYAYWQILPLNPLGPGESPYMSTCSYAIDFRYIDLDELVKKGLLDKVPSYLAKSKEVKYDRVKIFKRKYLYRAYLKYIKGKTNGLKKFKTANPWVMKYATYEVFRSKNKEAPWNKWPKAERDYFLKHKNTPKKYLKEIDFIIFMQYVAQHQWKAILRYARNNGIKIIADMPFYVGFDSVECWSNRQYFLLDENYEQLFEGGCPPDAFSDEGQKWGSPIYDFEELKANDYDMLIDRTAFLAEMCDYLRLDHFRAFDTYYVIPAGMPDAKIGEWKIGPRESFFDTLYKKHPNIQLIAEDLGELFPSVLELRDHYKFPGMFIVEFMIFDDKEESTTNTIVYPGTHDNETLMGWFMGREKWQYDHLKWKTNCYDDAHLFEAVFNYVIERPSLMTILPMQDLLRLGNEARINTPGKIGYPNWVWKVPDFSFVKKVWWHNK